MWCFVDGGALAEEVPRRLITAGAVFWVDVPADVPVEEIHLTEPEAQPVAAPEAVTAEVEAEEPVVEVAPTPKPTPKRRSPRKKK